MPCETEKGCMYVEGGLVNLLPENEFAWKLYLDGETIGYDVVFEIYDFELSKQEFIDLMDKIRTIKNIKAKIEAEKLKRKK